MGRFLYRLGGFGARHRIAMVLLWVVLAVAAVGITRAVGAKTNNSLDLPGTDSQAAFNVLAERFPPQQNGTSPFMFHVDEGSLTDPKYKPAMTATYKAIEAEPERVQRAEPRREDGASRRASSPTTARPASCPCC